MILLLSFLLLGRDEVSDQIAKLRETTDLSQQYPIANQIQNAVKAGHVDLLHKEIDAGPPAIRPHLIRALGRINTRDSIAALKALCQKHEIASRVEAALYLRNLGDDSAMKAVPALLPLAKTEEDKRQILYKLNGYYGLGPEAVAAILQFLQDEKGVNLRRTAVQMLGTFPKEPTALAALRKLAGDPADPLRHEALAAGIRAKDEKALEDGLAALEEGKVEASAVYSLLAAIQSTGNRTVLPRLRAFLEKTSEVNTRVAIIRALAGLRDADAVPLLTKLAEDENASVAKAAATALLEVDRKGNAEVARKMAADPNPLARIEAAEALLKQDNPEGYKGLKAELELKQSAYRSRVILALGQARRKESVEMLLPYIDDPDPAVGPNARRSLLQVLAALHPYLKFDDKASAEKIRAWWEKNR